ncbi:MAG: Cupin 2 conserved barrel domain protein [Clostridia bacterium]|jgi:quercetin dioxygenase-like cupin family protein|nr:Cupin 2 conserved barrel domain protein [Clostridia bacterium]
MFGFNEKITPEVCAEGVTRKILTHDENLMMVEVSFEKGAVGAIHAHIHEQISYIAKGSFVFDLNGDKRVVKEGDSIYIASNLLHGVEALEESIIVDVFTPRREDFLK